MTAKPIEFDSIPHTFCGCPRRSDGEIVLLIFDGKKFLKKCVLSVALRKLTRSKKTLALYKVIMGGCADGPTVFLVGSDN